MRSCLCFQKLCFRALLGQLRTRISVGPFWPCFNYVMLARFSAGHSICLLTARLPFALFSGIVFCVCSAGCLLSDALPAMCLDLYSWFAAHFYLRLRCLPNGYAACYIQLAISACCWAFAHFFLGRPAALLHAQQVFGCHCLSIRFPAKLSAKITSLQYIDLRELLQDNLGLLKNLEELDTKLMSASLPTAARPKLREVKDILTWVSCFTLYIAVLGQAHPHLMQQRLAYMALVVREARRNGGDSWRSYDAIFRQNAAVSPDVDWSQLDSALYTGTAHSSWLVLSLLFWRWPHH